MDEGLIPAYRALRSALCSVIHIPCRPDAGVFFLEILMTAFSKQIARATRIARTEAKRLAARVALLKHPAVRAAFEAFPPVMRKDINVSLSAYGDSVFMNTTLRRNWRDRARGPRRNQRDRLRISRHPVAGAVRRQLTGDRDENTFLASPAHPWPHRQR